MSVMELAGRVFDVVTAGHRIHESVLSVVRNTTGDADYWRRIVRMAALCLDSLVKSHGRGYWKREIIGAGKVEERTLRSR